MYFIPNQYFQRLHHPRPRFKKDIENVLGYMAFSIAEFDGEDEESFKRHILQAIKAFPGNQDLSEKTLNNWRTEITALFGMINIQNNTILATELTKDLANNTNLQNFFLRILSTFQYPGGFLKSHEIRKITQEGIQFHPLQWLSSFFSFVPEDDRYITDVEFCHCVLNDLRVTKYHEDIAKTTTRILQNRLLKIQYDSKGDIKRYALDLLDYCVLAGLVHKDYKGKYFPQEQSLSFFEFFKDNAPIFKLYKDLENDKEINDLRFDWVKFIDIESQKVLLAFEQSKNNSSQLFSNTKEIGDKGESLSLMHEKIWLIQNNREDLSKLVTHMPTQFAVGYDILSREIDATMKYIEVKTTLSQKKLTLYSVHLTPNEWAAAESSRERYFIYRLLISEESQSLWIIQDPVGLYKNDKIKMVPRNGADIYFDQSCFKEVELLSAN